MLNYTAFNQQCLSLFEENLYRYARNTARLEQETIETLIETIKLQMQQPGQKSESKKSSEQRQASDRQAECDGEANVGQIAVTVEESQNEIKLPIADEQEDDLLDNCPQSSELKARHPQSIYWTKKQSPSIEPYPQSAPLPHLEPNTPICGQMSSSSQPDQQERELGLARAHAYSNSTHTLIGSYSDYTKNYDKRQQITRLYLPHCLVLPKNSPQNALLLTQVELKMYRASPHDYLEFQKIL